MALDNLSTLLGRLEPRRKLCLSYDMCEVLFPIGKPVQGDHEKCGEFAEEHNCSIQNNSAKARIEFTKRD